MSSKVEVYRARSAAFRTRAEQTMDPAAKTFNTRVAECYAGLVRHQEWLAMYRAQCGPLPIDLVERLPGETMSR